MATRAGVTHERFDVDILRRTSELLTGTRPDLAPLQESWPSIQDPVERRHRRECPALLEAMVAVADRDDPLTPMARARLEIGDVHPSMRIWRLFARWIAAGAAIIVGAALVGSTVA